LLKEAASIMERKTIPAKLVNGEIRTIMYHPKIVYNCPFCNCEKEHEFDDESDEYEYKSSDVDGWEMTCSGCDNEFTIEKMEGKKAGIVLRFEEDSLRILRAIRFSSVLGFLIEEETNEAIFKYCFLLQNISKERIQSELNKILLSDFGADNITYYRFVFEEIFPNIILTPNYLKNTEDTNFLGKSLSEQLSLLLCENSIKKVEKFLKSLKYDNKTINEVIQILSCDYFLKNNIIENNYAFNKRIKYAIKTYGKRNVFNCLCYLWKKTGINLLDYYSEISGYNQCCTIKQLPINGDSLIELGYKGKEIGKILNDILDLIIEEKISNDVVMILDYIKKTYK
jgi:tRNA nucleotidyltransferase/poly(A) polymerase